MSLAQSIAKNTAVQIIGKAASTLLGLAAVAIMTRHLGVEKFGWYATATGFLQFFGIISDFGFTIITAKMLAEPNFDQQKLLNNLFTWRFLTAFVFQALAPIIFLFFPYPPEIKIAVAITSLSFFAISLNNIFIGYCQAKLQMFAQMSGEVLGRITLVLGLLFTTIINRGFIFTMGVITFASITYTFYLWIKGPKIQFAIDRNISREIFKRIWPTAITVILNAFYLQGDRVILPLYVSQTEVGLYGAAYRIIDLAAQVTAMLMGIMMPLVAFAWSRNLTDEFKTRIQNSFDLVLIVLMPIMAGIAVLAKPIIILIAGAEFAASANILRLLSLAIFGLALGNVFGYIALAINRQKQAIWIYLTTATFTTAAYFYFIPRYGIWGAAGASIFSEIFAGLGLLVLAGHYGKFFPKIFTALKILLASAIMGLIIYKIQPMNIFVSILVGVGIYGLLVILLKIISKQTMLEILKREPGMI